MHHLGSGFTNFYAFLHPTPRAPTQTTPPATQPPLERKGSPPTPVAQPPGQPHPIGMVEAARAMGVRVDTRHHSSVSFIQPLAPTDRLPSARALGGAVGWSITAQADAKSPGTDRRLLARLCEVASQEALPHDAVCAVARAVAPLPQAPTTLQRFARVEVLREAGRAVAREHPAAVLSRPCGLASPIAKSVYNPPEIAAMVHGISLEIRHQHLRVPGLFFHWDDLGESVNNPTGHGVALTHYLSDTWWEHAALDTMPLEQALLFLSSLRYHTQASNREIDRAAALIRTRPDMTDEVAQAIEQMVPVPGDNAAQALLGDTRIVFGERSDVESAIGDCLASHSGDLTPHLFTTAADVFVRSHRYHAIQDAGLDDLAQPRPAKADGLSADEIREEDFLTPTDLDGFLAFERALAFYDAYHQRGLAPLLAQARRTSRFAGLLPPIFQQPLRQHARVLRQELAELDQRPYIREALRPFSGSKTTQREALRARLRHPLAQIEALLQPPVTSVSTSRPTAASSSSSTTTISGSQ